MIHSKIVNKLLQNIDSNIEYRERGIKFNREEILAKTREYEKAKGKTKDVDDAIVELGYLTREEVNIEMAKAFDVEYINIMDPERIITDEALKIFKPEVLKKNNIVPYAILESTEKVYNLQGAMGRNQPQMAKKVVKTVYVACSNPMDVELHDRLAAELKNEYKIVLNYCDSESLEQFVTNFYSENAPANVDFDTLDLDGEDTEDGNEAYSLEDTSSKISTLVNNVFANAIRMRASDIHVLPREGRAEVKYRVDGELVKGFDIPIRELQPVINRIKTMGGMDISNRREPLDGRITITSGGKGIDMRVSTIPTVYGEKAVIRLLDKQNLAKGLEDVGLIGTNLVNIRKAMKHPAGIILVTGPTGSGKSTTLYTVLSQLNRTEVNIMTVEDPVEYKIDGLTQIQVNEAAHLTFASGLRAALRQDPDIMMVGEIRDKETGETAIQAANTGHLVLSTLHTNDALSAIARLADMGLEVFMLAEYVACITSQRLVKKLCECKHEELLPADAEERKIYNLGDGEFKYFAPTGCQKCNNTGYKGRIALQEVIYVDDDLREAIHLRKSQRELVEIAKANGMVFMKDDALDKIKQGMISFDSARKYIIK